MSTVTECTMCDGERGGWIEHGRPGLRWFPCTRCEGTGVEPGPGPQRTLDVEEYL